VRKKREKEDRSQKVKVEILERTENKKKMLWHLYTRVREEDSRISLEAGAVEVGGGIVTDHGVRVVSSARATHHPQ
jgi:hypothetical protein